MANGNNQNDTLQSTKRLLKGSAAFTSALLFGNRDTGSKGLLWTLGAAAGAAVAGASKTLASPPPDAASKEEVDEEWEGWSCRNGIDGPGYYHGPFRVDDDE
ncbi:hypothetical protein [Billgrantia ethanolica]|uniref:Uncharacterized protein n=1 Tax=Billgrantia ethanolica TaxID=2733486 RepID=A0ABS9A8Y2_9GAMM|nr:hypothetical protein [Halomonas ethanolica]MCE8005291.1 hypothetical protein [Halomonas ethanolica]